MYVLCTVSDAILREILVICSLMLVFYSFLFFIRHIILQVGYEYMYK